MTAQVVDFYLASGSPRRRQLLAGLGYRFAPLAVDVEERQQAGESGVAMAERLACRKALAGRVLIGPGDTRPVLGADTVVLVGARVLGKPADAVDCARMLGLLSGRAHSVLTAVAVAAGAVPRCVLSETRVWFRDIEPGEAHAYWASGEPRDKAGGYAIQGFAGVFVERIEGSYTGVVGLPVFETAKLLAEFGITGWQHVQG